jgi:predicted DCC family thiol-disulfide oxidoreductase YuxK
VDEYGPQVWRRPHLFFDGHCPPCQWMSRLAVRLSLGTIRRVPLESAAAQRLYDRYPQARGQLVLLYRDHMYFGRPVFAALPPVVLGHWLIVIGRVLRLVPSHHRHSRP